MVPIGLGRHISRMDNQVGTLKGSEELIRKVSMRIGNNIDTLCIRQRIH